MNSDQPLQDIFDVLDSWVSTVGNGRYMPSDLQDPPLGLHIGPIFGIQQVRRELFEFCQVLTGHLKTNDCTMIEIGLGHHGSTHFLWRQLFQRVLTIELNHDRVRRFSLNMDLYHKCHVLDDGKSLFVIGPSQGIDAVTKVYNNIDQADVLFIDGDHSYAAALSDWLLYSPLVKPGGIVAFNDSLFQLHDGGVPRLLREIQQSKFGTVPDIKNIFHSKNTGISYYIKQ